MILSNNARTFIIIGILRMKEKYKKRWVKPSLTYASNLRSAPWNENIFKNLRSNL